MAEKIVFEAGKGESRVKFEVTFRESVIIRQSLKRQGVFTWLFAIITGKSVPGAVSASPAVPWTS
jgi:hypothetical protein